MERKQWLTDTAAELPNVARQVQQVGPERLRCAFALQQAERHTQLLDKPGCTQGRRRRGAGMVPVHRHPARLHSPSTLHLVSVKDLPDSFPGGKPNVHWLPGSMVLLMRRSR